MRNQLLDHSTVGDVTTPESINLARANQTASDPVAVKDGSELL
jgi:hypothetical protein